jgi:hypothetical protein
MALSGMKARGLVAFGLAIGLVVAACGSSSGTPNALSSTGNNGAGASGSSSLVSGLSSNLNSLTSYQFTESINGSSTGSAPTAAATGSLQITGTVVNQPTKSMALDAYGVQYIVVGSQAWTSYDAGATWTAIDATDATLTDLLPSNNYGDWFDAYATDFTSQGNEMKNGVECVHYKGNSSLGAIYQGITGVTASFDAELWVAVNGNYPVSGVYGFSASSGGQGGSFGYSFDITHINGSSNKVTPPANVVAIPT